MASSKQTGTVIAGILNTIGSETKMSEDEARRQGYVPTAEIAAAKGVGSGPMLVQLHRGEKAGLLERIQVRSCTIGGNGGHWWREVKK